MIKSLLKQLIPGTLKKAVSKKLGVPDQEDSLLRIKNLGFTPTTILDIGAYEGHWTRFIKSIFPHSSVLMLEAQIGKTANLIQTARDLDKVSYKIELLGAEVKEVEFNIYETASSVLKEDNITNAIVEKRQLNTLDDVVYGSTFAKPDFIKIDTQGFELEILKGGLNTLHEAKMVLLEVSMIDIYKECPLVNDVLQFMYKEGFVLYDICSLMRRPYDKALFQSDFLFIKKNHSLRTSKRWE